MDLSLIICTWNNCSRLRITLDSISQCTILSNLEWELVLVNNNCTDNTDEVVREFTDALPIVYIHEPRQGLSRARNAGLNVASGSLILFTDDDVKPYKNWLMTYWETYKEKPQGFFFGGPVDCEYESVRPDEELLSLAPPSVKGLDWGTKSRTLSSTESLIAASWACPLKELNTVGGFDIHLGLDPSSGKVRGGEETNLMERLKANGLSPWYIPEAKIVHFVPKDKTTLKHISDREEAWGYYLGIKQQENYKQFSKIAGIPRWMYKDLFKYWLSWIIAKGKRKKGYEEYVRLKHKMGFMRGLRESS